MGRKKRADTTAAFLSYTRHDDRATGGLITTLKEVFETDVRFVTGKPIEIFLDRDDIGLGQDWRKRLESAIRDARFFIPVITPSYFESAPCTFELTRFHALEAAAGRDDLILPIYLQTAEILDDETQRDDNPLATLIHTRNWADWRQLYPQPLESTGGKQLVRDVSTKIQAAMRRTPPLAASAMPLQRLVDELEVENAELREQLKKQSEDKDVAAELEIAVRVAEQKAEKEVQQVRANAKSEKDGLIKALAAAESRIAGLVDQIETLKPAEPVSSPAVIRTAPNLAPGETFKDTEDGPEMVVVPPGSFLMGSPEDEAERSDVEGPQHNVRIASPFAVGCFAITFDEWDACVSAGGTEHRPEDEGWGRGRQPVVNVS